MKVFNILSTLGQVDVQWKAAEKVALDACFLSPPSFFRWVMGPKMFHWFSAETMDSVEQRPRQEVDNLIGTLHLLLGLDLHNHDAKTHLVFIFFAFYNCKSIWRHGILMLPGNTTGVRGKVCSVSYHRVGVRWSALSNKKT